MAVNPYLVENDFVRVLLDFLQEELGHGQRAPQTELGQIGSVNPDRERLETGAYRVEARQPHTAENVSLAALPPADDVVSNVVRSATPNLRVSSTADSAFTSAVLIIASSAVGPYCRQSLWTA